MSNKTDRRKQRMQRMQRMQPKDLEKAIEAGTLSSAAASYELKRRLANASSTTTQVTATA